MEVEIDIPTMKDNITITDFNEYEIEYVLRVIQASERIAKEEFRKQLDKIVGSEYELED